MAKESLEKLSSSIENVLDLSLSNCDDCSLLMRKLKEKLKKLELGKDKCKVLTIAPQSWTINETANYFGVSDCIVRQAREVRKNCGVLEDLPRNFREGLSQELKEKVKRFYESDDISRMCPGKKDYVSVRNDNGDKVKLQKRLLANLKKIYALFKKEHSEDTIGFS